jgi:hypothetical protein
MLDESGRAYQHTFVFKQGIATMPLTFLDKATVGSYLSQMWKKDLNTGEDPANGKWYENGANNDGAGLYGGLTDNAATQLQFNDAQKQYIPEQVVCDTASLDNRNGLAPQTTVQLSYNYTKSSSTTHTTSDSIKVGVGVDIKASATIFGIGADVTTKFSFEYTHSWGTATTESESQSFTFSQSVPVTVPQGKVYQVVLTAMSQKLVIPYTAIVHVSGKTETWFEDRINGHYNWGMDAGSALQNIAQNSGRVSNGHRHGAADDAVHGPGVRYHQHVRCVDAAAGHHAASRGALAWAAPCPPPRRSRSYDPVQRGRHSGLNLLDAGACSTARPGRPASVRTPRCS